ncbi:lamin tail domain-containing protein [Halovivax sp.]|uniref:lamin tail domain-containing protein n=1 Tax=Halovivax sp. TaxID=1935978 RepID=UPI0025BDC5C7|nr:lamin tail domain-containing protein [Halovivax sp.]
MRRRGILKGIGGIGTLLAASRTGATAAGDGLSIRIVETNDPVRAGDFLDVVAEVENATDSDERPTLELFVGEDRRLSKTTTIEAGESATLDFSHRTFPVREDVEFPVAVGGGGDRAERVVEVRGIDELGAEQLSPSRELTVQPGTAVLFEIESDALGEHGGRTHWYLENEYSGWSHGPWNWAFYEAQGADHWRRTFESAGTYGVAATVRGDDENYAARWTVEVASEGAGAPTIESVSPEPGPLERSSGETVELSADVSDPGGGLDRAVWWLSHADAVLGVSDLDGGADTASISTDELCHGCPIVLWVISERGTVTREHVWTPKLAYDGRSRLRIVETNDPVEAGGSLEVTVDVENATGGELAETVELVVGDERVDEQSLTLDPDGTERVTLGYETYPVATDVTFPVVVRSESDRETRPVDVLAEAGAAEITILETNDPVGAGEFLDVEAEIANVDDATITEDVHLVAGDRVDGESVTIGPGESEIVTLGYETYPVAVDVEFPVEVRGDGRRDSRTVRVYADGAPPTSVGILETNDPVDAGDVLDVTTEIENAGDETVTEDVDLVVGGERVDGASVTLAPGETTRLELGYETYPVERDVEFPVTVRSSGDADERTVDVRGRDADPDDGDADPDEDDDQDDGPDEDDDPDDDERADPTALELVEYHILGDDPDEEWIRLRNGAAEPLDASTLRIEDDGLVPAGTLSPFEFPGGFALDAGAEVTVVTGQGSDTDDTLYWGVGRHVWDEDGDIVYVRDEAGEVVLEEPIAAAPEEEEPGDEDGEPDDDPEDGEAGPVTVAIDETNAPVEGGEQLMILANLANNGTAETTETVELVVDGEVVDSGSVTVPGEATQLAELGYATYPVAQDVSFEVTVRTGDDSATTTVEVFGTEDPDDPPQEEESEQPPEEEPEDEPEEPPEEEPEEETEEPPEEEEPEDEPEEPPEEEPEDEPEEPPEEEPEEPPEDEPEEPPEDEPPEEEDDES